MHIIKISCKGAIDLSPHLLNDFQGELKSLDEENYEKLKNEILIEGFSFPPSVWNDNGKWFILDGHQRIKTILKMIAEGWACETIPCSIVFADSFFSAKRKLLAACSQYGHMKSQGLLEYVTHAEIPPEELEKRYDFPHVNIERFIASNYEDSEPLPEVLDEENDMRHASSEVHIVQLSFDTDSHKEFLDKANAVALTYGKESLSDTILELVREAYKARN